MLKKTILLILSITSMRLSAQTTNTLILTWNQPVGYHSTLYESTNLLSGWSQFSTSSPPVSVQSEKESAFFYVTVSPPNNPSILIYTNDPNMDGIKPSDTNGVGIAYDPTGIHGTYFWSANDQHWN